MGYTIAGDRRGSISETGSSKSRREGAQIMDHLYPLSFSLRIAAFVI